MRHLAAVSPRGMAIVVFASLTAAFALATTAQAQRNAGSVSVDLSALDQLGTAQNGPQLPRTGLRTPLMSNTGRMGNTQHRVRRFAPAIPVTSRASAARQFSGYKLKPPSQMKLSTAARPAPAKPIRAQTSRKPIVLRATPPTLPKIAAKSQGVPPTITAARHTPKTPTHTTVPTTPPGSRGNLAIGQQFRLMFGDGAAAVKNAAGTQLDKIANTLKTNETLRLQLLAYSGGGAQTPSQARRMSLSRALAVRSRLIKQGIRSSRIDVRALGNKSEGGPPDRVDVIVTKR